MKKLNLKFQTSVHLGHVEYSISSYSKCSSLHRVNASIAIANFPLLNRTKSPYPESEGIEKSITIPAPAHSQCTDQWYTP